MSGLLTRTTIALRFAVIMLKDAQVRHIPPADRADFDTILAVIEDRLNTANAVLQASAEREATRALQLAAMGATDEAEGGDAQA